MPDSDLKNYVRSVLALGRDLDATSIAEALWLAAVTSATEAANPEPSSGATAAPTLTTDAGQSSRPPQTGVRLQATHRETGEDLPTQDPNPPGGTQALVRGRRVRVQRVSALPQSLALARSLRPFKRRWPNGRRLRLDIEATVHSYARTWQLVPEFRPAPERWFEVSLVIDDSPSMTLWDEAISGIATLLQHLGAFRNIRIWRMSLAGEIPMLRNEGGQTSGMDQLRAPDSRRLIIVVSDGSVPGWFRPEVWQMIRTWAMSTPTMLISPLPIRLWRRTGLDLPAVWTGPGVPGSANARLRYSVPCSLQASADGSEEWLPIPAATLSPHMLSRWAETLMRGDPRGCDALLVPVAGRTYQDEPVAGLTSGRAIVEAFLRAAAPEAARLAVLCAPFAAVSLPLLHFIRQQLVPNASTGDVAEVIVGGLFLPLEPSAPTLLRFRDGVRARLQELLPEPDAWRTYEVLIRHINTRAGTTATFAAAIYDPLGDVTLSVDLQPFAAASHEALTFLGALPTVPEEPMVVPPRRRQEQIGSTAATGLTSAFSALYANADRAAIRGLTASMGDASDVERVASRVPSWPVVASAVRQLGGDEDEFRILWKRAAAERQVGAADQRTVANLLAIYRRHVLDYFGKLEPPDFVLRRRIPIIDIYVSPTLISESEDPPRPLDIQRLDKEIYRSVLLGDPGSGKTTACKLLMYRHATESTIPVPFLVTLRDFAETDPPEYSVVGYIEHQLETFYQCPAAPGVVDGLLLSGNTLVIFDGLDELLDTSRRRDITNRIEIFCVKYPLARVLVTSRTVGYHFARLDDRHFSLYRFEGFDADQIEQYVRKWFALDEDARPSDAETFLNESAAVADLRANPLMLALLCLLYRGEGSLPRNRPEIYEKCADLMFRTWDAHRGISRSLRIGAQLEPLLRHLAWQLFSRDQVLPYVTERELVTEATAFLQRRSFESESDAAEAATEFIAFIRGRIWVFSEVGTNASGEGLYSFTNRSFLEYFAAANLAHQADTPEQLARAIEPMIISQGRESVALIAAQIENRYVEDAAERIVKTLLDGDFEWTAEESTRVRDFIIEYAQVVALPPYLTQRLSK